MTEIVKYEDRDPWFDLLIYYLKVRDGNPDAYIQNLRETIYLSERDLIRDLNDLIHFGRERFGDGFMDNMVERIIPWLQQQRPGIDWDPGARYGEVWSKTARELADMLKAEAQGQLPPSNGDGIPLGRESVSFDDEIPWQGDDWDDLAPQIRRLLRHMHVREQDQTENVVEIVWETAPVNVEEGAIHTAISRANKFLAKHKHPRLLSKVRGEPIIRWV